MLEASSIDSQTQAAQAPCFRHPSTYPSNRVEARCYSHVLKPPDARVQ